MKKILIGIIGIVTLIGSICFANDPYDDYFKYKKVFETKIDKVYNSLEKKYLNRTTLLKVLTNINLKVYKKSKNKSEKIEMLYFIIYDLIDEKRLELGGKKLSMDQLEGKAKIIETASKKNNNAENSENNIIIKTITDANKKINTDKQINKLFEKGVIINGTISTVSALQGSHLRVSITDDESEPNKIYCMMDYKKYYNKIKPINKIFTIKGEFYNERINYNPTILTLKNCEIVENKKSTISIKDLNKNYLNIVKEIINNNFDKSISINAEINGISSGSSFGVKEKELALKYHTDKNDKGFPSTKTIKCYLDSNAKISELNNGDKIKVKGDLKFLHYDRTVKTNFGTMKQNGTKGLAIENCQIGN